MPILEIPLGFASVFLVILVGYFVLTVWFGKPPEPVVNRVPADRPPHQPQGPGSNA